MVRRKVSRGPVGDPKNERFFHLGRDLGGMCPGHGNIQEKKTFWTKETRNRGKEFPPIHSLVQVGVCKHS